MPQLRLHRDYVLRTTKGRSIRFIKDRNVFVPPTLVPDAIAIGAVPVDEKVDLIPDDTKPAELTPEQRAIKISEAIPELVARNDRGDFTGSGMPDARKLSAMVGFNVATHERDKLWRAYQQEVAEAAEE